jgi:hypothetical protein
MHDFVVVFLEGGFAAHHFDKSIQDGVGLGQLIGGCQEGRGSEKKSDRKLVHGDSLAES